MSEGGSEQAPQDFTLQRDEKPIPPDYEGKVLEVKTLMRDFTLGDRISICPETNLEDLIRVMREAEKAIRGVSNAKYEAQLAAQHLNTTHNKDADSQAQS